MVERTGGRETKIEVLTEQDGKTRTILLQCCPAAIADARAAPEFVQCYDPMLACLLLASLSFSKNSRA